MTAYAQDTIKGDSVCTHINQYRLDNIMITDLLNTRSEQGELIELKDKRLIAKDMIIQTQEAKISVLSDTLASVNGELSETHKKLNRSRKIGLYTVLVSLFVGFLY